MRNTSRPRPQRLGMTLIELLVVVVIVVLLLAVALPLAKPAFKDHKISEASRAVAGYISGAQARAAEIQRPVGIGIERMHATMGILPAAQTANGNATAIRLFLAEEPPPYVGDAIGARAYIQEVTTTPPIPSPSIRYYAIYFPGNSPSVNQLVSPGDRIRFDFKGAPYSIVSAPANPPYNYPVPPSLPGTGTIPRVFIGVPAGNIQPLVSPVPPSATPTAADYSQAGVPYQIYRKPVRSA
ncbi:MAG: prepilin-type N-terminal cleavage/methylation domain-containing protein, partial [Planctomycetales bacterium]|nr:prepilin-type N-terminal cleavage/methylation domain-containing protein [Planctomycetales bacterium]